MVIVFAACGFERRVGLVVEGEGEGLEAVGWYISLVVLERRGKDPVPHIVNR
jgi:hypothetical protein